MGAAAVSGLRSSLGRLTAASREPDPAMAKRAARAAWHEHGIILIRADWFQSWTDGKQAEILAEKLFGKRAGNDGHNQRTD